MVLKIQCSEYQKKVCLCFLALYCRSERCNGQHQCPVQYSWFTHPRERKLEPGPKEKRAPRRRLEHFYNGGDGAAPGERRQQEAHERPVWRCHHGLADPQTQQDDLSLRTCTRTHARTHTLLENKATYSSVCICSSLKGSHRPRNMQTL